MDNEEEKKIKEMLTLKKLKILKNTKAIEIGPGLKDDRQPGKRPDKGNNK